MLKKLFFIFAQYSGLNFLYKFFSNKKVFIVGYHSISSEHSNVSLSPEMFEKQIKFMVENNHTFIKFKDLESLQNRNVKKPTIIYFDDGFKDNILNVLPILKKYNIITTVFVVPKYTDSGSVEYMSWDDIREMQKGGIEIGSHTYNHANLTEIPEEVLKDELLSSKEKIEKEIGVSVKVFSYPKGRVNKDVVKAVKDAGYKYAVTTKYGVNSYDYISKNPYLLKKVAPRVYESFFDFKIRLYAYNIFR